MEARVICILFIIIFCNPCETAGNKCGKPIGSNFALEIETRIVAGYDVGYYRYPWYAALIENSHVGCGGALIGPRHVLTAAHCFKAYLNLNQNEIIKLEDVYTVKIGAYNICQSEQTVKDFKVAKVEVHELYKTKGPYWDIALLTLAEDASQYQPICLPGGKIKFRPNEGTVPGFGTLKYKGPMPCSLHEARLLIYSDAACHKMINETGNNESSIEHAFCAGYLKGGIDACQGDSGGPLQIMNENGDFVLLGIVSFGFHCAMRNVLGMYTDVSHFLKWIIEKSGNDPDIINQIHKKVSTPAPPPPPPPPPAVTSTTTGPSIDVSTKTSTTVAINRPYRRIIKIIIIQNNKLVMVNRSVLHRPLRRHN